MATTFLAGPLSLVFYLAGFKNVAALLMFIIPLGAIVGAVVFHRLGRPAPTESESP